MSKTLLDYFEEHSFEPVLIIDSVYDDAKVNFEFCIEDADSNPFDTFMSKLASSLEIYTEDVNCVVVNLYAWVERNFDLLDELIPVSGQTKDECIEELTLRVTDGVIGGNGSDYLYNRLISEMLTECKNEDYKEELKRDIWNKVEEGEVKQLTDDQITLSVDNKKPESAKSISAEDKDDFEKFKELYAGVIDIKFKQDYGAIEDDKLREDTAKELFLKNKFYLPKEDELKPTKIEESVEMNAITFVELCDTLKQLGLWDGNDATFTDAVNKFKDIQNVDKELNEDISPKEVLDKLSEIDNGMMVDAVRSAIKAGLISEEAIYYIITKCNSWTGKTESKLEERVSKELIAKMDDPRFEYIAYFADRLDDIEKVIDDCTDKSKVKAYKEILKSARAFESGRKKTESEDSLADIRMQARKEKYEKDLQYVKDIMAGKEVIDDKYNEPLDLDTAKKWLKDDYIYINSLASFDSAQIEDRLAKDLPEIFGKIEESKLQEDQYEAERRKGRPNLNAIAKEIFEYDDFYIDEIDKYNTKQEFIVANIADVAAEYNLKEQAAWAVMEKIYQMAKEAK